MGANASLTQSRLAVDPGGEVSCVVRVKNVGDVVDEFDFVVLGDAAPFATVAPSPLRLFPNGEGEATVTFKPPRSHEVPAGEVPFGIKVVSKEDPDDSVVEEGTIQIAEFTDLFAEVLPRTSRGRRKGKHEVAIDNRGNDRLTASVVALDHENLLEFTVKPETVVIEPGMASFAKLNLRASKRHWRGPPMTRLFEVVVTPEGQEPHSLNATFLQESTLPGWLPRLLRWLLMGGVLLALLWFFVLKPTIETSARDVAREQTEETVAEQPPAAGAEELAAVQDQLAAANAAIAGLQESIGIPPTVAIPNPTNFDVRLAVAAPAAATRDSAFVVPDDKLLTITDIILQNPQGHAGELRVIREFRDEDDVLQRNILLIVALQNFRDLDYHFVTPLVFVPEASLIIEITCDLPAAEATECGAGAYFGGNLGPGPGTEVEVVNTTAAEDEPAPEETP